MDFNSNSNREKIITIICMVGLALFILSRSCGNDSSSSNTNSSAYTTNTSKSPVGSYRRYSSDKKTYYQYNINSDGTASITGRTSAGIKNGIMTYEDRPTLHTYWEYLDGSSKDIIRIKVPGEIGDMMFCYMVLSENKMYLSRHNYRSKHSGHEIIKIN